LHVQRVELNTMLSQGRHDKFTCYTGAVQLHGGYDLGLTCISAHLTAAFQVTKKYLAAYEI